MLFVSSFCLSLSRPLSAKAVELQPCDPLLLTGLATVLSLLGKKEEAHDLFVHVTELDCDTHDWMDPQIHIIPTTS